MSRVGKMPIAVPQGVDVKISAEAITVKGGNGTLNLPANGLVTVTQDGATLKVAPVNDTAAANAMSGTFRALLANTINGVSKGFEKKLTLVGVGFKAQAAGQKLNLSIGFSHPVVKDMPAGIKVETPSQTEIVIKGAYRQVVGQIAAEVRAVRPSPTRARASAMRTSAWSSKRPRRSKELIHHGNEQEGTAPASCAPDPRPDRPARRRAFDGHPQQPAHLRQRDFWRRQQGHRHRVDRRKGSARANQERCQHRSCLADRQAHRRKGEGCWRREGCLRSRWLPIPRSHQGPG